MTTFRRLFQYHRCRFPRVLLAVRGACKAHISCFAFNKRVNICIPSERTENGRPLVSWVHNIQTRIVCKQCAQVDYSCELACRCRCVCAWQEQWYRQVRGGVLSWITYNFGALKGWIILPKARARWRLATAPTPSTRPPPLLDTAVDGCFTAINCVRFSLCQILQLQLNNTNETCFM